MNRPRSRVRKPKSGETVLTAELEIGPHRRKVYVLDDLVHESIRQQVFETIYELPFYHADFDRDDTQAFRHMVHLFEPSQYDNPLLQALTDAAQVFLAERGERTSGVGQMYVNFGLFGDHQFAHTDGDNVWTALVFVNQEWHTDWAGELLLYDDSAPRAPAWAIAPEPGRMVIFDGRILHRGGVPSKHCFVPRLSLAIKLRREPERKPGRRRKKQR